MTGIKLKLIRLPSGKVALGPSGNLGPKSKLLAIPKNFLDAVPKVDASARRATIIKSAALATLSKGSGGGVPRQPLGAIGGSGAKPVPGSFLPSSAASKVQL